MRNFVDGILPPCHDDGNDVENYFLIRTRLILDQSKKTNWIRDKYLSIGSLKHFIVSLSYKTLLFYLDLLNLRIAIDEKMYLLSNGQA